jgi:hypothetical protein
MKITELEKNTWYWVASDSEFCPMTPIYVNSYGQIEINGQAITRKACCLMQQTEFHKAIMPEVEK